MLVADLDPDDQPMYRIHDVAIQDGDGYQLKLTAVSDAGSVVALYDVQRLDQENGGYSSVCFHFQPNFIAFTILSSFVKFEQITSFYSFLKFYTSSIKIKFYIVLSRLIQFNMKLLSFIILHSFTVLWSNQILKGKL